MKQFNDSQSTSKKIMNILNAEGRIVDSYRVEFVSDKNGNEPSGTLLNAKTFNQMLNEIDETFFIGKEFKNISIGQSGEVQEYIIPRTGKYHIKAAGAKGGKGAGSKALEGGKGAIVEANFELKKGDLLLILVGQKGYDSMNSNASSGDYTGGGGGGGTFVFRKISSVNSDLKYNFEKDGSAYEVLLVAAGGGGSSDATMSNIKPGADGDATTINTPDEYEKPSTTTFSGTKSLSVASGGSIQQYITYNGIGNMYTRNNQTVYGGYGCGAAADDSVCSGGGWSNDGVVATSWSMDINARGITGGNTNDHGYCIIAENLKARITFENNKLDIETIER